MAYCTQQNLVDRFGEPELIQLTDRTNAGVVDTTVLGQAIADADAEIDSYLRARYPLPLLSVPAGLTRVACDIARYEMYDVAAPELVEKRFEQAIQFLKDIATGRAVLPDSAVNAAVEPQTGVIVAPERELRITDAVLEGMV
jgi:phage gp36-like protein